MNRLQEVTLLRAFAVLSLVMWHCYCPYICWGTAESPLNGFYTKLFTNIIPDANMPLFTFLAGYLFYYLHEVKGKYRDFREFFLNKVHRLLIPFLVLGLLINLLEYGKHVIDYFYGIPNHLWYCLMLFYVYCVFWIIQNKVHPYINAVIAAISFGVIVYYGGGALSHRMVGGGFLPLYYYAYFYAGYMMYKEREVIFVHKKFLFFVVLAVYLATVFMSSHHFLVFKCLSYIILLMFISHQICVRNLINKHIGLMKSIDKISYYSFGIYVFHQWIVWNITRIPVVVNFIR